MNFSVNKTHNDTSEDAMRAAMSFTMYKLGNYLNNNYQVLRERNFLTQTYKLCLIRQGKFAVKKS